MLSRMRYLWANLFRKAQRDRELDAEVSGYVEMLAAEKMRAGMSADQARRAATIEAGGVEQVKESVRDIRTGARLEGVWLDIRHGSRMLARTPGFTAVAVITLALGIGANTATFSVVDAVLFRPLPYEAPDRLVIVSELAHGNRGISVAYANYLDWAAQNQSFEHLAIYNSTSVVMQAAHGSDRLSGWIVSVDFLRTLGVPVSSGRDFSGEDERSTAQVVLITDGLWKRRFGGDPAVVNSPVTLDGKAYTVIGVLPSSFRAYFSFSTPPEVLVPFAPYIAADPKGWLPRSSHAGSSVVARLKPGVSLERARADLKAVAARLEQQYPDTNAGNSVLVQPIMEDVAGDIRPALLILLAAVGAVLLIACTNLANLQLARSTVRSGEIAVRMALGAPRVRVLRQLLTESVLLSALGGTLGTFLAMWCVNAVVKANPRDLPRLDAIAVNGRVLVFTLGLSLVTGVLFGLLPAWQASSGKANVALKDVGRSGGLTRSGRRIGNGLIVAEMALSLLLLVCAGLLIRSFVRLQAVNPGFNPHGVLTFRLALPEQRYPTDDRRMQFYEAALERIRALPGVEAGGGITPLPMAGGGWQRDYRVEGQAIPKNKQFPSTDVHFVTSDYFWIMQIPLLRGRLLAEGDRKGALPVVVINETAAEHLWPNHEAVGKRIRTGAPLELMSADGKEHPWCTVVGVVGDVHQYGLERAVKTEIYFPASQAGGFLQTITVRASVAPLTLAEPIRRAISGLDAEVAPFRFAAMEEYVSTSLDSRRLLLVLMFSFAAVAVLLAAIGIYGVISYSVSQRTREIGVRMALGASRGDVLRMVLGQSAYLLVAGVALGLLGSALASAVLRSQLYAVRPHDPATFVAVSALLVLLALVASYIPARRAMRVDPMAALRYE